MAAPVITVAPFIYDDYRQDPRLRGQNTLSLDFFLSKQFDESVKIHINEKPLLTWVIDNKWNQDLIPEFNLRKFMALVSHPQAKHFDGYVSWLDRVWSSVHPTKPKNFFSELTRTLADQIDKDIYDLADAHPAHRDFIIKTLQTGPAVVFDTDADYTTEPPNRGTVLWASCRGGVTGTSNNSDNNGRILSQNGEFIWNDARFTALLDTVTAKTEKYVFNPDTITSLWFNHPDVDNPFGKEFVRGQIWTIAFVMRIQNSIGETATELSEYFDKIPRHYCSHFDGGPNPRYNPARVIQREVFSQLDTVLYSALCTFISQNPDSGIVTRIDGYTEVMDLELNYHIGSRFKASLLILFKYNSRPKQHMLRRAESIFNSSLKYHEDYWLDVFLKALREYQKQVRDHGGEVTDEELMKHFKVDFLNIHMAMHPQDNYAQELYDLAKNHDKVKSLNCPREHVKAWKDFHGMFEFSLELRHMFQEVKGVHRRDG